MKKYIHIKGASENNLKNIDLEIEHNKITVVTGVSGSGKSSLVHDIICKESQRRYLESFSSYARQYLKQVKRPDVNKISGLPPAISVDQKTTVRNPRSTVGTMSELNDYLRLLFARIGKPEKKIEKKIERRLFSFNSPYGACPKCNGLGVEDKIDPKKLISDDSLSLREGALVITTPSGYTIYSQVTIDVMDQICNAHGFTVDIPWKKLTEEEKKVILHGTDKIRVLFGKHSLESRMKWSGITAKPREEGYYKGIIPVMEEILKRDRNKNILRFVQSVQCSSCDGKRLNDDALGVKIQGYSIADLSDFTLRELNTFFEEIKFKEAEKAVGRSAQKAILKRTKLLNDLGLGYLSLSRESTTLSGGEAQRIRLVNQVAAKLRNALYILDEPSIGLHPHDTKKLLSVLNTIAEGGNTVLLVEHDDNVIQFADQIIDIGPKAGKQGGELIYSGPLESFLNGDISGSLTHQYLTGQKPAYYHDKKRLASNHSIQIISASHNNLQNIDVTIPLGQLTAVTGVSGAGKSSLIHDILANKLKTELHGARNLKIGAHSEILGTEQISKIIEIDQSPIGRTPRSNPATYTKLFDHIRDLFAALPESKEKGWKKGRFSFNNKGGRCETCQGAGSIQIGMHFMGYVDIICSECKGKRFNNDTLSIEYKGKNIYDVLEMSIDEVCEFFKDFPKAMQYLSTLQSLGLGYLNLGQQATTLSGGEAQRIKLAAELSKQAKGHTLYILDEPTTGLHMYDVNILLKSLHALVDAGHSVIIIEHHGDVIRSADQIIDLGPGSGDDGGTIVAQGSLEDIKNCNDSITGKELLQEFSGIQKKGQSYDSSDPILFKGVSTHNLKNIDVEIPVGKMTVLTGVSGSGKSSLAFDTVFSEGQKRYAESFSSYVRTLLKQKGDAEFESVSGIIPAIAVDQRSKTPNPRSTLGTMTEIYDLYRLIFARFGEWKGSNNSAKPTLYASDFSFNHEDGACPECKGLGYAIVCDPQKLISHPGKSLLEGAMDGSKTGKFYGDPFGQYTATLEAVGQQKGIDFLTVWNELDEEVQQIAMFGSGDEEYEVIWKYKRKNVKGSHEFKTKWIGFAALVNEEFDRKHADKRGDDILPLMKEQRCHVCSGSRLKKESSSVMFADKTIAELSSLSVKQSIDFFQDLNNYIKNESILRGIEDSQKEILKRLRILNDIGLPYLTIDRRSNSLSGGEARRMHLASQIVSGISGILYVLDEPSIGLHKRDSKKLIALLKKLNDEGNTLLLCEHDREIILEADHIIDMGPGAGSFGGQIIAKGSPETIVNSKDSKTGPYLKTPIQVKRNDVVLKPGIQIFGAHANNLKHIDIWIPSGGLTVLTGVSGSGKSSLIFDVLFRSYEEKRAVNCNQIDGFDLFEKVINVDQSLPGKSSLSNICTYTGMFETIRKLFAETDEAKNQGFKKNHFSLNTKGGRCETCKGQGKIKTSMDFLADVSNICEDCKGKRYKEGILQVNYHGKSIHEVLTMTIQEANSFFKDESKLKTTFTLLINLGLDYITLGQTLDSYSGGELQRLKLATSLMQKSNGPHLYLLDEPTTGLHFEDIEKLIFLFDTFVQEGHTVLLIEHNEDMIHHADHLIELGPEGGEAGGYLIS